MLETGWSSTWAHFLNTDKTAFLKQLEVFYSRLEWTRALSDSQLNAWKIEYGVMCNTLRQVCQQSGVDPALCWIAFEQELVGEGGKRAADVNLVLPTGDLIVIEFKHKLSVSEHEIWRANFDLKTMLHFHSESIGLTGHCFMALTKPGVSHFDDNVVISDVQNNDILPRLADLLITALTRPYIYDVTQWQKGVFYRQPSILHGTVQVFFKGEIPTLKTSAGENIVEARHQLNKLYADAKQNKKRYLVVVNGRPGAGKTLLGISTVADLVKEHGAEQCKPMFLSGNRPLVKVLQHTLDFYGKQISHHEAHFDSRSLIQDLIVFKRSLMESPQHLARKENFIVFDEAQRAWEKANSRDSSSPSELEVFCRWLAHKEYGVLVLLVGDGQAIHNNEMSLDKMFASLNQTLATYSNHITTIMPSLHAHYLTYANPIKREVFNLKTPIRQAYTEELDRWIEAVLIGDSSEARRVSESIHCDYPLLLAQTKNDADAYVQALQQTLHEDNKRPDAFRVGWLMSSKGGSFINEVKADPRHGGKQVGPWYVEPPGSKNSCCQLDAACTEFSSQGLELSIAMFNWGQDLLYQNGKLALSTQRAFKRKQDHYTFGSYRVLLSRGRSGLIIKCDDSETYRFLQACGMKPISP
ncbi:DNA/RNA helicase domain-containing protein [Oceanisphaera ostreae]|uniref:DNA/RNA helicase domain-containing protein n=1 Tax=Oceanisphaera ostreae TaxID=914151 RepID=A0ABW3KIB5_9GAMM